MQHAGIGCTWPQDCSFILALRLVFRVERTSLRTLPIESSALTLQRRNISLMVPTCHFCSGLCEAVKTLQTLRAIFSLGSRWLKDTFLFIRGWRWTLCFRSFVASASSEAITGQIWLRQRVASAKSGQEYKTATSSIRSR